MRFQLAYGVPQSVPPTTPKGVYVYGFARAPAPHAASAHGAMRGDYGDYGLHSHTASQAAHHAEPGPVEATGKVRAGDYLCACNGNIW